MKIYSNQDLTNRSDDDFQFIKYEEKLPGRGLKKLWFSWRKARILANDGVCAVLIFHPQIVDLLTYRFLKWIRPNTKVLYFDILLKKPSGVKDNIFTAVKKRLLKCSDLVLCVHKDTSAYNRYYGIDKTLYVPFKANNFYRREDVSVVDKGYVLSCGVSHRDYETFFKAIDGLPVDVKVAFPDDKNVSFHKARIGESALPKNVEIVRHDFDPKSWNELIAGAKFVVIPITSDCIQPAGISVYLESMALGKAVIISEGTSTVGLIDQGQARLVKRGDVLGMREAVIELLDNPEQRRTYEERGYEYAMELGGVDRMIRDLKGALSKVLGEQKK